MRCLWLGVVLAGCGTSNDTDVVGPFTGETHRYVIDELRLLASNSETAAWGGDLDGNGRFDNQLGYLIAMQAGFGNVTSHGPDMIAAGAVASSVEIVADDLVNDPTVGVRYLGTPSSPYVVIGGRFEAGAFSSNLTAYSSVAGEAELHLPVFTEADPSLLHAIGVEMFLEPDGSGRIRGHDSCGDSARHAAAAGGASRYRPDGCLGSGIASDDAAHARPQSPGRRAVVSGGREQPA